MLIVRSLAIFVMSNSKRTFWLYVERVKKSFRLYLFSNRFYVVNYLYLFRIAFNTTYFCDFITPRMYCSTLLSAFLHEFCQINIYFYI